MALPNSLVRAETQTILHQWKILIFTLVSGPSLLVQPWERDPTALRAWEQGAEPQEVSIVYTVLRVDSTFFCQTLTMLMITSI